MSNDIDLEQFIQVLDHALATDDPKIKKALKKFLFIAALALEDDPEPGPFTAMFEEMDDLRKRIVAIENAQTSRSYDLTDYTYTGTSAPTWKYNSSSTAGTITVKPSTTTSSCTSFTAPNTITASGSTWSTLGYTINLGDDEKGKRIKDELTEKLGGLSKSV